VENLIMVQPLPAFGEIAPRLAREPRGGGIGRNRDLHRQGAGSSTIGLVAIEAAGVAVGALPLRGSPPGHIGRVMQGGPAGIGFPGAGVPMRRPDKASATGLTTAATIASVAGLAMPCDIGNSPIVGLPLAFAVVLLVGGRRIELLVEGTFGTARDDDDYTGDARGPSATPRRTSRRRSDRADDRSNVLP
jgi:uncharacterized membrane protein YhiD involved in acid resistance